MNWTKLVKITFSFVCLIFAVIYAAGPALSQTEEDYLPRCGGIFDLCGFVDRQNETELIPAMFERAFNFSEGLAAVRIDGAFGYIDLQGEIVIEPQFDLVGDFYEGLAEVLVDNVVGVIDHNGRFVVEPQFARAVPFTADTLIVVEGDWRNGYFSGSERLEGLSGILTGVGDQKVGLYHTSDGWIADPAYQIRRFGEPRRGLIWATTEDRYRGPFGLLRADGTWQIEPTYTHVQSLNDGLAVVRGASSTQTFQLNGRSINPSGAVDEEGKLVIPLQFNFLSYWNAGYGLAQKEESHALVSPDGTLLAGRYFDEVERPEDGRLPRVWDGENWFSVEPDGTLIKDQNEGSLIAQCPSGLSIRKRLGQAEFSHPNFDASIGMLFDSKYRFNRVDCTNPISVSVKGKWGYVTQEGQLITDPPSFDDIQGFKNGNAAVSLNGLWGIIDKSGQFVVEPIFERLRQSGVHFQAQRDGREFWINARGNEVPEPAPETDDHSRYLECGGGVRLFAENEMWGMLDANGDVLIAPTFRALSCFSQGVAWSAATDATAWCAIGPDGQPRKRPKCRPAYYPYIQTHHYPEKFTDDPYESSVLWVRAFLDYGLGQRKRAPIWISDGGQGDVSSSISRQ